MDEQTARIRKLNDDLRCNHRGGKILITCGIEERGAAFIVEVDTALGNVNFTADNDPYDEHDFGACEAQGRSVFFKIDYYDLYYSAGSPDPADPDVTRRVMTIMLAEEY